MAGRNPKPNPGFDPAEKVNSNTLKRHPKMDLSRNDLLQLLTYLEGELQARDIAIATLKAEKAKQLLFQAKYGRFGLGDPFSAMQRDSDNMKDTTFDESAIKSMYDNQLAQLENLIATQRKAQMKMREQMLAGEKRYQKVCSELDEEKKKHAQDTAQGDDVTYMLEKERERLRQEVEFEKGSVKKMEKDMKKTLASLEEERASSVKHKQVALMLIKERKKLVEKYVVEKQKADLAEKVLSEERSKSMNMAEGLVQESKKSLKMEATMERQASEFDLEREQLKNKLHREENRNKELAAQIEELTWKLDNIHKQKPSSLKEGVHTVEIKSTIHSPPIRLSSEKSGWSSPSTSTLLSTKPGNIVEREAGLSPRNSSSEMSVRKHDNTRYASPHGASVERGQVHQYADHIEQRVAPVGAVADSNKVILDSGHKLSVSLGGPTVVSSGGRITVQTSSPPISSGQVSPRRMLSINRGTPPPIPPNKPILPATTSTTASVGATTKPFSSTQQKVSTMRDGRPAGSKPVHIPVSVVHTTSISSPPTSRATKHEGSPSSLRKPAQLSDAPVPPNTSHDPTPPTSSESFDFLGQEMADLQQLLVSMVSVSPDTPGVDVKSYRSNPGSNNDVIIPSTAMTSSDYNMTSLNSAVMSSDSVMTSSHSMTSSVPEVTSAITTLVSSEPDASNFRTNVNKKNEQSEATTSLITSQMQALSVETEQNTPRGAYSMSASSQSPSVIATASLSPRPQNNTVVQSESSPPSQFYDSSPLPSSSSSSSSSSQSSAVPSSYQSITHSSSSKSNDFQVPTPKHDHTDSYTTKIAVHQNGSVSLPQTASPIVQATFPMSDKQNEDQSWYSWGVVHGKQTEVTLSPSVPGPISSAKLGSPASTDYVRKSVDSASASLGRAISAQQSQGNLDLPTSPIHRFAAMGNVEGLHKLIVELEADVNLPMKDGTTPAHCAAERGQEGCLRLLLQRGCHVNCLRDDQQTPLHCATVAGHTGCLQLLLENGSNPHLADYAGWTPLHWAAFKGYRDGCRILLVCGASQLAVSNTNWTPVHLAVHSDRPEIVDLLLTYQSRNQSESLLQVRKAVCEIVDKDEMTLAHMAAMKESPECLSVICCHCDIDVNQVDKWGRSVIDVSSNSCRHILQPYALASQMRYLKVQIQCTGPLYNQYEPYVIGQIELHPRMHWGHVAGALHNCAEEYFSQLDHGLRTKKVSRLDPDSAVDDSQYSLGFSYQSIACFQLGNLTWTLAIDSYPKVKLPVVLSTLQNPVATILLKGSTNDCESLAFDLLLPVVFFQSLTRLMEQYKAVMFYGPEGTRKKYLVTRLAKHLAEKERQTGTEPMVSQMYLHSDFKHRDFVHFLTSEGCLLPVGVESECSRILVLYGLEKVQFSDMLGSLTQHIDHRGGQHSFPVPGLGGTQELCYFPDNFYLIGTMDKPRSTGLDLNVQQRFRWVYFPVKNEPIRNLLGRHFLRRLLHIYGGKMPSAEDDVFKVIEWIVCVWQRLNDGVNKLGLPDIVFGPNIFMTCPLETGNAQVILNWLRVVWNEAISPVVRVGVSKGTGKDGGQQKVSNTALYVLMQRAIVPGCPLAGKDKDNYLQGFSGTNELEVPLTGKSDRWSPNPASSTTSPQRRSLHNGHQQENNRAINRHSTGSPANVPFIQQNYNNNNNSAFKRRSLSDNTLQQHDRIEIPVVHEQTSDQPANLQAKVPKLEIRSPVLGLPVSLPLPFPTNNGSSQHSKHARSTLHPSHRHDNTPTSHQRRSVSTVHSKIPQPSKRSKSSENLASTIPIPIIHHTTSRTQGQNVSQGQNQLATSPFTFSLASTTPSLFSFKTYDHRRNSGAGTSKSRSLTSSPTSLLYPQSGGKR